MQPARPRAAATVAVIGAGHVGAAVANALVLLRTCVTVVLFDRTLARAEGEAWDIDDTTPLLHEMDVIATDHYDGVAGADVVIITAGVSIQRGHSRLEALGRNAGIIRGVISELDRVAPGAAVIMVSNPVDVLTRIAIDSSARPERLIMGTGTVLDTARLRYQLAKDLGVAPQDTYVHVIGEHGDSELPVWSAASIGGVPLSAYPLPGGASLQDLGSTCLVATRRRGYDIFERKGHTNHGIAVAACQIAESILRDEKRTFSVSVRAPAGYGIGTDIVLGLPCVIGKGGVERKVVLPRDPEEQRLLQRSADVLNDAYASLGSPAASSPVSPGVPGASSP
jgi:L-lactate dehydrogenase